MFMAADEEAFALSTSCVVVGVFHVSHISSETALSHPSFIVTLMCHIGEDYVTEVNTLT
jgi:hypothetical protein